MAEEGFPDWQRRHFQAFIKALERYGRDSLDEVALEIADHTEEEVREYAAVFFDRYKELKGASCLTLKCRNGTDPPQTPTSIWTVLRQAKLSFGNRSNESNRCTRKSDLINTQCRSSSCSTARTRGSRTRTKRTGSCLSGCIIMGWIGMIAMS